MDDSGELTDNRCWANADITNLGAGFFVGDTGRNTLKNGQVVRQRLEVDGGENSLRRDDAGGPGPAHMSSRQPHQHEKSRQSPRQSHSWNSMIYIIVHSFVDRSLLPRSLGPRGGQRWRDIQDSSSSSCPVSVGKRFHSLGENIDQVRFIPWLDAS